MERGLIALNGPAMEEICDFSASLALTQQALAELGSWVQANPFGSDEQEISFFKYIKPRFQCWQIYLTELQQVVAMAHGKGEGELCKYYRAERKAVDSFIKRHASHYRYYRSGASAQDSSYFLLRNARNARRGDLGAQLSHGFSTRLGYLFAKFKAMELFRDWLCERIKEVVKQDDIRSMERELRAKKRTWSGSKVELVELAYGLYHSKRINGGQADLREIIAWLEESLDVELEQSYRMFVDICRRKIVSHTKFLEEMQRCLQAHIHENVAGVRGSHC